jgi:hypothetical protein
MSAQSGQAGVSGHTAFAIAARQRDLVTIEQLLATGLPRATIYDQVARGVLHRRHRGVYSLGGAPLSPEAEQLAALLACGPGAALRRLSAAQLYGCSRFPAQLIEIVSPRRRKVAGARDHHCRTLSSRDVTDFNGIPVTTAHRMFVDLADALTPHQLANVVHQAAYRGRYVEAAIRDVMARMNGRHHLAALEQAMEPHRTGSAGTKSGAEDAFLRLPLPEPLVNMHLLGREVDFHWLQHGVVVDGLPWTVADDDGRDAALRAADYTVLRFSARDVYEHRDAVSARTAAALASSPGLRHAA